MADVTEATMASLSPFDEIVQGLIQDQNGARIKKLLVYACRNVWEGDPARLSRYSFSDLVQELMHIAPSIDQLKTHLTRMVGSLSKSAEYTLVARAILNHLRPLYLETQALTQIAGSTRDYCAIANRLEQDVDAHRIHKLLFCACCGTWENDLNRLGHYPILALVQQLYDLAPTAIALQSALDSIVQTLNRQVEYRRVAQTILTAFEPLYTESLYTEPLDTQLLYTLEVPEQTQLRVAVVDPQDNKPPLVLPPAPPQAPEQLPPPGLSPAAPVIVRVAPRSTIPDRFELRLEVMKYTIPLRAKVLLFSVLHYPLDSLDRHGSILKTHDLDELLQALLRQFPGYSDLEARLRTMAQALADPDQYSQAAGAILRAVRPLYAQPAPLSSEAIALDEPAPQPGSRHLVRREDAAEDTCSFQVAIAANVGISEDHTSPLLPPPPPSHP